MKKRILSILLTLCMVMCAISPVMSYADPGVSASGSSAYGALPTPDTTPPAGWAEDESNPYGTKKGQPFAITPWYEPIIYSYRNAERQAAQDHTKVNIYLSSSIDAVVFFPSFNGGVIFLSAVLSVLLLKEKLKPKTAIGIILGIAGICIIGIL